MAAIASAIMAAALPRPPEDISAAKVVVTAYRKKGAGRPFSAYTTAVRRPLLSAAGLGGLAAVGATALVARSGRH